MQTVNVHAAKTHFSHLLEQAEAGEEVVVARAGKPVARLVAFGQPRGGRVLGVLGGTLRIPADFDAALPDEVLAAFEGG